MTLRADQRERYARHLLLAEIGEAQQRALCDAHVVYAPGVDPAVLRTARDYLKRAGASEVRETHGAGPAHAVQRIGPSHEDVRRLAGRAELEPAAAAMLGAFEAVEALKQAAGVGREGSFPPDLRLSEEQP